MSVHSNSMQHLYSKNTWNRLLNKEICDLQTRCQLCMTKQLKDGIMQHHSTLLPHKTRTESLDSITSRQTYRFKQSPHQQDHQVKQVIHYSHALHHLEYLVIDFLNFLCDFLKRIKIVEHTQLPGLVFLNVTGKTFGQSGVYIMDMRYVLKYGNFVDFLVVFLFQYPPVW